MFSRWALDRDAQGERGYVLETNNEITLRKRTEQRQAVNLAVTKILAESPAPFMRCREFFRTFVRPLDGR